MVLALVARGMFFLLVKWLALRAGQRQGGVFRLPPPYLWTPLSPQRVKGCSPLTIPMWKSKPKNASRFAKRIFLCFSYLRLRRRFHVSAGRYRQQRGNTSCEAASRRNEKKAFSEAASFFPFRPLLRGLKGASSPFLVDPARRNRWCFSGSLLARKRELSLSATAIYPAHKRVKPFIRKLTYTKIPPILGVPVSGVPINYSNSPSGRQMSAFGTFSHEKSLMRLSGVRGAGSSCKP